MKEKIEVLSKNTPPRHFLHRHQAAWKTSLLLKNANEQYTLRAKGSRFELQIPR